MAKPPAVEVLLDNFTLQGAYGYLHESQHGRAFDRCLAHLVEAVVLYDRRQPVRRLGR